MSRSNKDKWKFIKHPIRDSLSVREVAYWKASLNKVLKVGVELEFNLPEAKGVCKRSNPLCVCQHFQPNEECWKTCALESTCKRVQSGKACLFDRCSSFVSACVVCNHFVTPCETCEFASDPNKDPEQLRNNIMVALNPSHHYGTIGNTGVHSVIGDGSLLGGKGGKSKGVEVITVGRRVDYWEFFKMANKILTTATKNGAWLNERCSIHMHLLASYYHTDHSFYSELEKPVPEIILANFHQLVRRYQNALVWMTMGLKEEKRMTRWEKYRVSILEISALKQRMPHVKQQTYEISGGNKYAFTNYTNMQFDRHGDATTLHIELRYMDGIISPSIVAAMACLNHALMIKAVEISRYGLLKMPGTEWLNEARRMKEHILNNMKAYNEGDRFGHTGNVLKHRDYYVRESLGLIQQLKHILLKTGPAYDVLEKLAETPAAIMRIAGSSWDAIEAHMRIPITNESALNLAVNEYIDLRLIDRCNTIEEWIKEVTISMWEDDDAKKTVMDNEIKEIPQLEKTIEDIVKEGQANGELIWSDRLGALVSI